MTWNDILGFLIVLFIFLLPLLSKLFSGRGQKKETHPRVEEVIEEEEESTQKLPHFTPPTPMVARTEEERFEFHSRLERKKKKKKHPKQETDPLSVALRGKTPLQTMMLASQILEKPKSLQDEC